MAGPAKFRLPVALPAKTGLLTPVAWAARAATAAPRTRPIAKARKSESAKRRRNGEIRKQTRRLSPDLFFELVCEFHMEKFSGRGDDAGAAGDRIAPLDTEADLMGGVGVDRGIGE